MTGRDDVESDMQQTEIESRPITLIGRSDPAIQVVDSAYQIVTMIGANPRAIRPILAQRRITKEQVLEAADSLTQRAGTMLAGLDAAEEQRRAQHESTVAELKDHIAAWQAEDARDATQREQAPAEVARLQAELDAADAAFAKFQAEQRGPRTYLSTLRERAERVHEVYQAL
jgi:chromosome segregation ATPase